ncbi:hypothetical protein LIER_32518 [Lithospermum erythrorhizon]|uniref:Uncharacterized protein n=1 Tax=Lithospermum erythrorhizon TaxID=34254 RepID=A0AAV3RWK2_LITER
MAGIIHELKGTIVNSVLQQRREQIPLLRKENPMDVSSVREEEEETYTHTPPVQGNHEPTAGQQSYHEAAAGCVVATAPQQDSMAVLRRQVDSLSARVPGQTQRGKNNE